MKREREDSDQSEEQVDVRNPGDNEQEEPVREPRSGQFQVKVSIEHDRYRTPASTERPLPPSSIRRPLGFSAPVRILRNRLIHPPEDTITNEPQEPTVEEQPQRRTSQFSVPVRIEHSRYRAEDADRIEPQEDNVHDQLRSGFSVPVRIDRSRLANAPGDAREPNVPDVHDQFRSGFSVPVRIDRSRLANAPGDGREPNVPDVDQSQKSSPFSIPVRIPLNKLNAPDDADRRQSRESSVEQQHRNTGLFRVPVRIEHSRYVTEESLGETESLFSDESQQRPVEEGSNRTESQFSDDEPQPVEEGVSQMGRFKVVRVEEPTSVWKLFLALVLSYQFFFFMAIIFILIFAGSLSWFIKHVRVNYLGGFIKEYFSHLLLLNHTIDEVYFFKRDMAG